MLWGAYYPNLNSVDIVSELYLKEATLDKVVQMIKIQEKSMGLGEPIMSFGSPEMTNRQATSNQSIASMMSVQGVNVERGNTDRIAGWARIANLISRGTLRHWPQIGVWGCPNLARTLPRMQRNTGLGKDPNDLRPRQEDHAADALRYLVMGIYELAKAVPKVVNVVDNSNRDLVFDKIMQDLKKSKNQQTYYPDLGAW